MLAYFSTLAWILGLLGSLIWIWLLLGLARHREIGRWLSDIEPVMPSMGWPRLAVIFAARNEGHAVEAATRSMISLDYPDLELVAVNDRSTDDTGAILDRLALDEPRLRVVHVKALPPGWLGKSHALQQAASASDAEWLLFTDADIHFAPDALRRAIVFAEQQRLDHLVVAPDMLTESFGERIFLTMFVLGLSLFSPLWKVSNRRSKVSIGAGAFNLVRASAFRSVGGFERIRLSIDDDLKLGQLLKYGGYRQGLIAGLGVVWLRWHVGWMGMIRGMEKNAYAVLDFKLRRVVVSIVGLLVVGEFPFIGLFLGPYWSRAVCFLALSGIALLLRETRGQNGMSAWMVFTIPLGTLFSIYTLCRSTFLTRKRQGVRWRDHTYSLDQLIDHVRERNEWLAEVWKSTR